MKKALFLTLPFAMLILVTGIFILAETSRSPDWEVELNQYLIDRNTIRINSVVLKTVMQATKPWNFSDDTFYPVFGDNFNGQFPYPPEQIQCVLLVNSQGENEIVFVSYHTDQLWNIDWVIHKSIHTPSSAAFLEDLQTIGCDFALNI